MKTSKRTYLPAVGHDWLLPLYDPLVKLLGIDSDRKKLIDQSDLQPDHRVLDIGCGTGTLVILIKSLYTDIEIAGLDPDPKVLNRARKKTKRAGFSIRLDQGFSDELPYADKIFDQVFSSFMFHHLDVAEKKKTLHEVRRVLKPGGSFHLLDFAHSESQRNRESSLLSRWVHTSHPMKNNSEDLILSLMEKAGLADPEKTGQRRTFFARIVSFQATVP